MIQAFFSKRPQKAGSSGSLGLYLPVRSWFTHPLSSVHQWFLGNAWEISEGLGGDKANLPKK